MVSTLSFYGGMQTATTSESEYRRLMQQSQLAAVQQQSGFLNFIGTPISQHHGTQAIHIGNSGSNETTTDNILLLIEEGE